jgi:caa(3)-type oxidase subunit IV
MNNNIHKHHHHILPTPVAIGIGCTLLFLTIVTVWVAGIDLGPLNFAVAMVVASIKAALVMLFFMNLKYDRRENAVIFLTSFLFLAVFIVLTGTDMFFRGDVYVKGPLMAAVSAPSKISKPWISSPELVAKGTELYAAQCVACHGTGDGKGPAAAALNPPPRNFTDPTGWKNGRKPTMVFKTLKEGLPPSAMASYATLPADDRWALVHYVLTLAPNPEKDTPADFAKIGVDPTKESVVVAEAPTISIKLAQQRMTVPTTETEAHAKLYHPNTDETAAAVESPGAKIYQQACIQCHGEHGEGGIKTRTMSVKPPAYVITSAFKSSEAMKSQESFNRIVEKGIPGNIMPGNGQLTGSDLRELYQYVKALQ